MERCEQFLRHVSTLPDETWYVGLIGILGGIAGGMFVSYPWFWTVVSLLVMRISPLAGRRSFAASFELTLLFHYLPFWVVVLLWSVRGAAHEATYDTPAPGAAVPMEVHPPESKPSIFGSPDPIPHSE